MPSPSQNKAQTGLVKNRMKTLSKAGRYAQLPCRTIKLKTDKVLFVGMALWSTCSFGFWGTVRHYVGNQNQAGSLDVGNCSSHCVKLPSPTGAGSSVTIGLTRRRTTRLGLKMRRYTTTPTPAAAASTTTTTTSTATTTTRTSIKPASTSATLITATIIMIAYLSVTVNLYSLI